MPPRHRRNTPWHPPHHPAGPFQQLADKLVELGLIGHLQQLGSQLHFVGLIEETFALAVVLTLGLVAVLIRLVAILAHLVAVALILVLALGPIQIMHGSLLVT